MASVKPDQRRLRHLSLTLALADLRSIVRDTLLLFLILLPLGIALMLRFILPDRAELDEMLRSPLPADIEPYRDLIGQIAGSIEPLAMGIFTGMSPGLIGSVYGLLLVDERDERTLAVLRVMPVHFGQYLAARIVMPCSLAILVTVVAYPIAGMAPLPWTTVALIAIAGATTVPVVVLAIATFAPNKVAALAVMRVVNAILVLPFFAYFASMPQEMLAWPVPSYWQMKALWLASDGQPWLWCLALTVVMNLLLSIWLYHRFARRSE